jgi:hypothetical protein
MEFVVVLFEYLRWKITTCDPREIPFDDKCCIVATAHAGFWYRSVDIAHASSVSL